MWRSSRRLWDRVPSRRISRRKLAFAGLKFDRATDIREAQQSATGLDVLERVPHGLGPARGGKDPEHELGHVVSWLVGLGASACVPERSSELFLRHLFERSHLSRSFTTRGTMPSVRTT